MVAERMAHRRAGAGGWEADEMLSELRGSPRLVLIGLVVLVTIPFLAAELRGLPYEAAGRAMNLIMAVVALGVVGWTMVGRWPFAARWYTVGVCSLTIYLAAAWLRAPVVLTMVSLGVAAADLLLGARAAMATALGDGALIGLLWALGRLPGDATEPEVVGVSLVSLLVLAGLLWASERPLRQLAFWAAEYMDEARRSVLETRDRKAELKQALADLAHANRQLALAGERAAALRQVAEEARRAKTAFVANVSHEFRTPLNMIIGLVELMVDSPEIYTVVLPPEMRHDLQVVHRNCEHLADMVNDVLDLTRMEAGRLTLHRQRVDLRAIIASVVEAVSPLIDKKGLDLRVEASVDLPDVYCDATRIEQVILNLVSNAARFTEAGGITIGVEPEDREVQVRVTDTGPGIAGEDIERIFEPFGQGTEEMWRDRGGSGLGLSISQQFVGLHGGRMWLESELGVGTSFFFSLPISPPLERAASAGSRIRPDWVWHADRFRTDRASRGEELIRPRVVVCDSAGVLSQAFARHTDHLEIVVGGELQEAVTATGDGPAHLLVINERSRERLLELMEDARQLAAGTPIVGCAVAAPESRALSAGADGYLIKPVRRQDLADLLDRVERRVGDAVRRVLIVDDDPDVLRLFGRMLDSQSDALSVITAPSAEAALTALAEDVPDLILLDAMMPAMSGWDLLGHVRADPRLERVPTYFVSGQDPADEVPSSDLLLVTCDQGVSLKKLVRCSLETATILLGRDAMPDPAPAETSGVAPASKERLQLPAR